MGFSCSFMDNKSYGADDINLILSKLTTQGISLFKYADGDNPLIALNDAVNSFTGPGIEYYNPSSCMLEYFAPTEENAYAQFRILPGNAFMYDGSIITIDENGYDISDEVIKIRQSRTDDIYVYFNRNVPNNTIDICVSCDYDNINSKTSLMLGKIEISNKIHDLRTYSISKVAPCSKNVIIFGKFGEMGVYSSDEGADRFKKTIDNIFPGASYVLAYGKCFEIQCVSTTTGDELTYEVFSETMPDCYVAFNRVGTSIQIWMSCRRSHYEGMFQNYIIV